MSDIPADDDLEYFRRLWKGAPAASLILIQKVKRGNIEELRARLTREEARLAEVDHLLAEDGAQRREDG